jgi:hypothetical protein
VSAYAKRLVFYSGPGGATYQDETGDVRLQVSAGGVLQLVNLDALNTLRVVGFVFASPDLGAY